MIEECEEGMRIAGEGDGKRREWGEEAGRG